MSRQRPKYSIEISCDGHEYETGTGMWACYDTIVAEGNSLEECLDDASVSIIDQDGGELRCSPMPADKQWMQALIEERFRCPECKQVVQDLWCDGENDPICEPCRDAWFKREALSHGIPLSVIEGRTKLSDHFSEGYIRWKCDPKGQRDWPGTEEDK